MTGVEAWQYAAVFVASAALVAVLTPLALRLALRKRILDEPGGHKSHESAVPYLGGLAMVTAFVAALLLALALRPPPGGWGEPATILLLGAGLSVVGLLDDLKGLGPGVRVVAQIAAALALWFAGVSVDIFAGDFWDLILTVGWVVGLTNAFNLLDNMDGLSAGVAAIAAGSFFVIAAVNGQFAVAALAAALAGCALGFLRHNFHPAKIYMGDAGSLFLGFLLAVIGIKLRFEAPTSITFIVPIMVVGVAILDTSLVSVTRLLHGRNPFQGGRDHISHRLVFVGIPVPVAVSLVYGAAIGHGWFALVASRVDRVTSWLIAGFIIVVDIAFATVLAHVPVYETSRQRHLMIQEVTRHDPQPARPRPLESQGSRERA